MGHHCTTTIHGPQEVATKIGKSKTVTKKLSTPVDTRSAYYAYIFLWAFSLQEFDMDYYKNKRKSQDLSLHMNTSLLFVTTGLPFLISKE